MTKETFETILREEITDTYRLVICTRGFHGRGINGLAEVRYQNTTDTTFEMVKRCDEYIMIRYGYNGYMRKIYIPYEHITHLEQTEY